MIMISIKTVAAVVATCLCAALLGGAPTSQSASGTKSVSTHALKQVATFDLPGPIGKRFDYLTVDTDDDYLLSAHLGAGILYVINLKGQQNRQSDSGCAGRGRGRVRSRPQE